MLFTTKVSKSTPLRQFLFLKKTGNRSNTVKRVVFLESKFLARCQLYIFTIEKADSIGFVALIDTK